MPGFAGKQPEPFSSDFIRDPHSIDHKRRTLRDHGGTCLSVAHSSIEHLWANRNGKDGNEQEKEEENGKKASNPFERNGRRMFLPQCFSQLARELCFLSVGPQMLGCGREG
ncbi:Serine/threonine-protein kinase rio1 [Anopheles sinensis]|uniref:Serine/threonine-protein kinase rio1 n=1 Tax=Anopheles sinensis TaxID=74873 RepID=A0A084V9U0_ANOSI|nr:Serine/threonine-protein kinase rio1 [Anopheles sinensis]